MFASVLVVRDEPVKAYLSVKFLGFKDFKFFQLKIGVTYLHWVNIGSTIL